MGKKTLLSSDNCGYCEVIRDALKDKIERGDIDVINIDRNKDAKEIAKMFGGVPTLIEEKHGEIYELVLVEKQKEKIKV